MSDNLNIFGKEYSEVTSIVVKDNNNTELSYIRPQGIKTISSNASNIDVYDYQKVNVNVDVPGPIKLVTQDLSGYVYLEELESFPTLTSLTVSSNGTYYPQTNEAFSEVTVNVPKYLITVDEIATRNIGSEVSGNASTIVSGAFYSCPSLTSVSFSACISIGTNAFAYCSLLTTISFPNCTSIGNYAFYQCSSLTEVSFPNCTSIGTNAFAYCSTLTTTSFPNCTSIGGAAFAYCYNLLSFYLLGSSVCSLMATNAFNSTPISNYTTSTGGVYGSIYVPSSLYNTYINATNWTAYAARFVSV